MLVTDKLEALGAKNIEWNTAKLDQGAKTGIAVSFDTECGRQRYAVRIAHGDHMEDAKRRLLEWATEGFARNWNRHKQETA